jgi:hypothetical protein
MTNWTTNGTVSLKLALAAANEARRLLAQAAHNLDIAGCEAGGDAEATYSARDEACSLRDMACDLCDEINALVG